MQIEEEMKTLTSFNSCLFVFFSQIEICNIDHCKNKQTDGRTAFCMWLLYFSFVEIHLPEETVTKNTTNFT